MAQSYAGYHHIVCVILENNGGNDYLWVRNGLLFGVRKLFMTTDDGKGVVLVPEPIVGSKGSQQQVLTARGMKHVPPDDLPNEEGTVA